MNEPRTPILVADPLAYERMLEALDARAGEIGVDTEFMRTNTYFPQLCLLQIATDARIYCIDPLSVPDLRACYEFLVDAGRLKTMHAARQDLEVLSGAGKGRFAPLFDTQIAATLAGHPDQVSYAWLAERYCGVTLDKSQTRTDWAQRPLSEAQLGYAASDVRHLGAIRELLERELAAAGKLGWLEEECTRLVATAAIEVDPEDAWRRLKGLTSLTPPQIALAGALAAWREREARRADRPRTWILRDEVLLATARRAPTSAAALAAVEGMPPATVRRHACALLELVATTARDGAPLPVALTHRLTTAGQALVGELQALVQDRAAAVAVVPTLVASRRDLELAVLGEAGLRFGAGWRAALVGEAIAARIEAARGQPLTTPR